MHKDISKNDNYTPVKTPINKTREYEPESIVAKVAKSCQISERQVRRVLSGKSKNDKVVKMYNTLIERNNALLDEVNRIVKF